MSGASVLGGPARTARAALVALALTLAGCQDAFEIEIAAEHARVDDLAFTIAPRDAPGARPRYHSVQLFDAATEARVWHLRAAPFGTEASRASLRYGGAPEGFEAVTAAAALEPGKTYVLVVSGAARGQLRFRVDEGGGVRAAD